MIKSRILRQTGNVARMEEDSKVSKILIGKFTAKRLLGRLRFRWKENIRMDPKEIGVNTSNWIDSALDREPLH